MGTGLTEGGHRQGGCCTDSQAFDGRYQRCETAAVGSTLSPDVIAEVVAGYRDGSSTNQLWERFGLSKAGLLKILQEHGVQMRNQPMTEEEIELAVGLYRAGDSVRTVAVTLGKAKGSVWKALTNSGIEMRPSTR